MDKSGHLGQIWDKPIIPLRITGGIALEESEQLLSRRDFGPIGPRKTTKKDDGGLQSPLAGLIFNWVSDFINEGGSLKSEKLRGMGLAPCLPKIPLGSDKQVATGVYGGRSFSTSSTPPFIPKQSQSDHWNHINISALSLPHEEQSMLGPAAFANLGSQFASQNISDSEESASYVSAFKNANGQTSHFSSSPHPPKHSQSQQWNPFQTNQLSLHKEQSMSGPAAFANLGSQFVSQGFSDSEESTSYVSAINNAIGQTSHCATSLHPPKNSQSQQWNPFQSNQPSQHKKQSILWTADFANHGSQFASQNISESEEPTAYVSAFKKAIRPASLDSSPTHPPKHSQSQQWNPFQTNQPSLHKEQSMLGPTGFANLGSQFASPDVGESIAYVLAFKKPIGPASLCSSPMLPPKHSLLTADAKEFIPRFARESFSPTEDEAKSYFRAFNKTVGGTTSTSSSTSGYETTSNSEYEPPSPPAGTYNSFQRSLYPKKPPSKRASNLADMKEFTEQYGIPGRIRPIHLSRQRTGKYFHKFADT